MENKLVYKLLFVILAVCCLAFSSCVEDAEEILENEPKQYHGIDVSHHQGKRDWE